MTFVELYGFVDSKQDVNLCLKVNKGQRKCHAICVGVRKIYYDGSFQLQEDSQQSAKQ